jgi:hypothetical protein
VAELVDAPDLGSDALCMGVRVPSLAPMAIWKHIAFKLLFNAKRQMNSADGKIYIDIKSGKFMIVITLA